MSKTELKARIQLKANTTTEWSNITLTPLKGELVAYIDSNETKIKIGDGSTALDNLPFVKVNEKYLPLSGGVMDSGSSLEVGTFTVRGNSYFKSTLQILKGNFYVNAQSDDSSKIHQVAQTSVNAWGGSLETGTLNIKKYFGNNENNVSDPVSGWQLMNFYVTDKCNTYLGASDVQYFKTGGIYYPNNASAESYHQLGFSVTGLDTSTNLPCSIAENYRLPIPDKNRTDEAYYDILTSKNIVTIAQGGTGTRTTPTIGGVIYGSNGVYASTSAGTSGQLLKSNGASAPSWINQNEIAAGSVPWTGITGKPNYYDGKAIINITRDGLNFTYTCLDGTTGSFDQQDNDTTYSVATSESSGLMDSNMVIKLASISEKSTNTRIIDKVITIEAIESDFDPENMIANVYSIPMNESGDIYVFADLDLSSATTENITDLLDAWNCVDRMEYTSSINSVDLSVFFLREYPKISFDVKLRIIANSKI